MSNNPNDSQGLENKNDLGSENKENEKSKLSPEQMEAELGRVRSEAAKYRVERNTLKGQIDELSKQAEKGSTLEKSLNELSKKYDAAEKRALFMETSLKTKCRNPSLAFLLANEKNLYDAEGKPKWDEIKKEAPELFEPIIESGDAGSGTGTKGRKGSINDAIRKAAGH